MSPDLCALLSGAASLAAALFVLRSWGRAQRQREHERERWQPWRPVATHYYAHCRACGYTHPVVDGVLVDHERSQSGTRQTSRCPGSGRVLA